MSLREFIARVREFWQPHSLVDDFYAPHWKGYRMLTLTLTRDECGEQGQYGVLSLVTDGARSLLCQTMEHAYDDGEGGWCPKVPTGMYTCQRGTHALSNGIPFETFEVTGVPGHSGILFHTGNTEQDSHGCILLGETRGELSGQEAVLSSKQAFAGFMLTLEGQDTFSLVVEDQS